MLKDIASTELGERLPATLEASEIYQELRARYIEGPDEMNWELVRTAAAGIYQTIGGKFEELDKWLKALRGQLDVEMARREEVRKIGLERARFVTTILGQRKEEALTRASSFDKLKCRLFSADSADQEYALKILALLPPETLNALFGGVQTTSRGEGKRDSGSGIDEGEMAILLRTMTTMWSLPPQDDKDHNKPDPEPTKGD